MEFLLTFQSGPEAGKLVRLELGNVYSIGRAPDVQIHLPADDNLASRYHATLTPMMGGVELQDLHSRNGSYVNGVRRERVLLVKDDQLRIGRTEMTIEVEAKHDTLPAPPPDPLDALRFDDADLVGLEPEATEGIIVGPGAGIEACEGCGKFGPAPSDRFAEAGRLCAECARSRRTHDARVPEFIGPYELIGLVGQGATGAVYEARHRESEAHVALKVLIPDAPLDRVSVARFLREQRVAITLRHPRIVRSFDVGEEGRASMLYLATEWLPGGDAATLCSPQLSLEVALSLGADIFDGLGYLHARGFIHRDVKPDNLLLFHDGPGGVAGKLSDFGIVKNALETGSHLTMDRDLGGTPLYVAPEQLLDFKRVGKSSDLYSGAASIYALLTGSTPLPLEDMGGGRQSVVVYTAALEEARVPIKRRRPDVPPEIAEWIDAAVARDPAARQNMEATQIAAWLRGIATSEW